MPIKKEYQALTAKSTKLDNFENPDFKHNDQIVKNNMEAETLIDPEDNSSGSTYSADPLKVKASTTVKADDTHTPQAEGGAEEGVELDNHEEPDAIIANEDSDADDSDWDVAPEDSEDDIIDEVADEDAIEEVDEDLGEDEADVDEVPVAADSLPLVDVDGMDDSDVDNVVFASFGTKLMVIKANRIVATLSKAQAVETEQSDVYLSDEFQDVVASEMTKKGLRAGLQGMGFILTRVNVGSQQTVNARVAKEVQKTTAAVRKVTAAKEAAFDQSLAIAAVGINRGFFKDQPNELRAALEKELQLAGVRGGAKLVDRVFASFGPSYAKAIVTVAQKIAAMPQTVRDDYVNAIDLVADDAEFVTDIDEEVEGLPIGAEESEDEFLAEATVSASLANPGVSKKVQASAAGYSVAAQAVLNGDRPLF